MEGVQQKVENNLWNDIPLFMTELPEDISSNPALAAIQDLIYDGPPEEVAERFKDQGNEAFRSGKKEDLEHALVYYTKALEQKSDDKIKNSVYLSNRAAVNTKLGNYGRVIEDIGFAIRFDPNNSKAYGRAAHACLELGKLEESLKWITDGLCIDDKNSFLLGIKRKVMIAQKKAEQELKKKNAVQEQKKDKLFYVNRALQNRNIVQRECQYSFGQNPLEKLRLDEGGQLHFPVLFLYPEYNQTDFVEDFMEFNTFEEHLQQMFPAKKTASSEPLWDLKGDYVLGNLCIFFASTDNRWLRVDPNTQLINVVSSTSYTMPGFPAFYILSQNSAYMETFMQTDPTFL